MLNALQRLSTKVLVALFCVLTGLTGSILAETPRRVQLPPGFQSRVYVDQQGSHAYSVFIPVAQAPSDGWPVVLFFHGAGERGSDGLLPASVGLGTALEQSPQPFIAVFPQNESLQERYLRSWEAGLSDAERALKILAEVESAEHVNPNKRILCGWSMGGYGAWSVATKTPRHWSAVLALSGGAIGPLDLAKLAESQTPVWAIHGVEDELIPATNSESLIDQLKAKQGIGHLSLVPDVGHDAWRYAFAQPQVFQWMLAPSQVDPQQIDLNAVQPLPDRCLFYTKQLSSVNTIHDAMSLRLGNEALRSLANKLPETVSAELLQGKLDDIERTLTTGDSAFQVKLSNLSWSCTLGNSKLQAIAGGRFKASLGLHPMTLTIGNSTLNSDQVSATLGEIKIVIGHQFPEVLELEIQPAIVDGALKLIPLRSSFEIAEHNWFIQHPTDVEVNSQTFEKYHVITGIVGGLYQQRDVIEDQVLGAVPQFLNYLEDELQNQNAPQLAKMLWPLPVLVPELHVSPSQVRTDRNGISVVLDLKSISYGPNCFTESTHLSNSFQVKLIPLRSSFEIAEHNWFIQHPTDVEVNSQTFEKYHVVTGMVGGLYQQRHLIEEQVLGAVPQFLKYLEDELQNQNAPQLAKMLWPLPVLVPELHVSPSQVRTDRNGISVVLDLKSISYGPNCFTESTHLSNSFQVKQILPVNTLSAALSLGAVESISQSIVAHQTAQINVLDLPHHSFEQLVSEKLVAALFPECDALGNVQAVLQLNGPFLLEQTSTSDAKENVRLSAPQVAVSYLIRTPTGKYQPLGTFQFALIQDLSLQLNSDHQPATIELKWSPTPRITDVRFVKTATSLPEITPSISTANLLFEIHFLAAWTQWVKTQSHSVGAPRFSQGDAGLTLKTLNIHNNQLQFEFSDAGVSALSKGSLPSKYLR